MALIELAPTVVARYTDLVQRDDLGANLLRHLGGALRRSHVGMIRENPAPDACGHARGARDEPQSALRRNHIDCHLI